MRNSVLETDGQTDRGQVHVLSCASQLKIELVKIKFERIDNSCFGIKRAPTNMMFHYFFQEYTLSYRRELSYLVLLNCENDVKIKHILFV